MRQFVSTALLMTGVLVVASACSGGGGLSLSPTAPKTNIQSVEHASFSLVNQERTTASSAGELSFEQRVAAVARQHSENMRDNGFFSHISPDGKTLRDRLREAGIEFRSAAENLVKVTNSADPAGYAHTLLMQQPQHRSNILNPGYQVLGVGATKGADSVWITQIFVER